MARTIHGIDLTAPDGIKQLLDFHRMTFGDAVMEDEGAGTEGEGAGESGGEGDGADGQGEGTEGGAEGEGALGDAGKKALDSMKAKLKAERAEKTSALAELKAVKDAAELADKKPEEQELARVRKEAADEATAAATAKANARILRADIKAAAAGKLKNPDIAIKLLDLNAFEADDEGNFDQADIDAAIGALLTSEPYLAAQGGTVQFDSGRGKQAPAGQITKDQLDKMSPAEVLKANREGRLKSLTKK